ncbi:protein FRIGIDA-like [Aristolochia californica]|uniref:protein FRIGIDA-like n=1 Tax=Aristolochia californica TaxID=171875 RepID=UPI0035E2A5F8
MSAVAADKASSSVSFLAVKEEPLTGDTMENGGSSHIILKSVDKLRGLSGVLSVFTSRWNDLQSHLDSIQKYIEQLEGSSASSPEVDVDHAFCSDDGEPRTELERICETVNGKALRKYVALRLSDPGNLRDELQAALKRSPDLGKLVISCIGRFYIQGSRAFDKQAAIVSVREACIIVLECFLLAGGCAKVADSPIKKEAEEAAIAWKMRLVKEGGIEHCKDVDAQGLLLFIASFGVPPGFGKDDLCKLMQSSKINKNSDALRSSPFLQLKLEDMLQGMVKNGRYVAAVDLSCAFGLEEKFPPKALLLSFLNDINQKGKQMRREGQSSRGALKAADEKQLHDLKLVAQCLEKYQLDLAYFLNWKIDEKIEKLEKDISLFTNKLNETKRKAIEQGEGPEKHLRSSNLRLLPQRASPGSLMPLHQDPTFRVGNGLPLTRVVDERYIGMIEEYSGASRSPKAAHLAGYMAAGAAGVQSLSSNRRTNVTGEVAMGTSDMISLAAENRSSAPTREGGFILVPNASTDRPHDWHQRNALVDSREGPYEWHLRSANARVDSRDGSYEWHQRNAAALKDDVTKQDLSEYFYLSEGLQNLRAASSNRESSKFYQFPDARFDNEASYSGDLAAATPPAYQHRPSYY